MPEIKVITPKLELLDNVKSYSSNKYIINDYKEPSQEKNSNIFNKKIDNNDLILKRSKPFRKYTNTLEKCMNLTIKK